MSTRTETGSGPRSLSPNGCQARARALTSSTTAPRPRSTSSSTSITGTTATLNLGESGESSLLQLAAIREYLPAYTPKVVLWFFYEGQDLRTLYEQSAHPLVLRATAFAGIKLVVVMRGVPIHLDSPETFAFVVVVPATATFTYQSAGTYPVGLSVSDGRGGTASNAAVRSAIMRSSKAL